MEGEERSMIAPTPHQADEMGQEGTRSKAWGAQHPRQTEHHSNLDQRRRIMSTKGKALLAALASGVTTIMMVGVTWASSPTILDQITAAYCQYVYVCYPWGCIYEFRCW
jgi:hypothetical protein